MSNEMFSEQFVVRMTPSDAERLDAMMHEGKYSSRAQLVRSILRAILDDDDAAHGKVAA